MAESVLILRQGAPGALVFALAWDADSTPVDATGWTARCQIRAREDPMATLLAELEVSVVLQSAASLAGAVTTFGLLPDTDYWCAVAQWTAEESLLWDWPYGYSDVLLIDDTGTERDFAWAGILQMDKAVTVNG